MSLLSRLVLGSPAFARQLLDAGALLPRTAALLLAPTNPPPVLVDALLTVSQLARITRDHYAPLAAANCYSALRALLGHWDPGVRARACNLVGNMCRHGADFYPALLQHGLLQVRIRISTDTVAGQQPWPAVSERGWLRGRERARATMPGGVGFQRYGAFMKRIKHHSLLYMLCAQLGSDVRGLWS